ncbi:hst3 protein [Ophiostoma piceae UAMH 11346]|uniref:Hst3 protein n=1 Tax=Ophiostoma piceae (strain UAMH 11346) TaxID=1262450 RepID=S3CW37_OPHP1|nr:hst3 protein [Ophiostoma piceae UAMH 11346]
MPTCQVLPESAELLQDIADALYKAKKVLVVTGAGISTNSGIPDFRSKNGLYSLIQAQFDAANDDTELDDNDDKDDKPERDEPLTKRQKVCKDEPLPSSQETTASEPERAPIRRSLRRLGSTVSERDDSKSNSNSNSNSRSSSPVSQSARSRRQSRRNTPSGTIQCAPCNPLDDDNSIVVLPALNPKRFAESAMRTPQRRTRASMLASSDSIECLRSHPISSPLSSPPSVLFDPSEEYRSANSLGSSSSNSSLPASACSSDAESDTEEKTEEGLCSSQPALSTQSSFASSKGALTTMKGRDLFDASIWADPVKTSVFYTFATTLRQKVREVVPTRSHEFISHLRDSNKLVRCYTQNIDEIEEKVGLSTSLNLGPGKKTRFSTRSLSRMSTGSTVGKDDSSQDTSDDSKEPELQEPFSSQESQSAEDSDKTQLEKKAPAHGDPSFRGVECVFLHGSLRLLRCFRCGQTTPWDEDGREHETMSGRQPSCPRCAGATAAREGRGKRALAVGKLRPDIVLYGEEHPNAHLISPIVQHDLSLAPDMLLILGTSLKVHGLKVLVREFSKAVHNRGGKVVFVNFTKPPESVWSDIIDYWVQWDCDAWVQDLKEKKPIMWMPPGTVLEEPKKKRKSICAASKGARKSDGDKLEDSNELVIQIEASMEGEALKSTEECVVKKERKKREPKEPKEKKDKPKKTKEVKDGESASLGDAAPDTSTETESGDKTEQKRARKRPRKSTAEQAEPVQDNSTAAAQIIVDITQSITVTVDQAPSSVATTTATATATTTAMTARPAKPVRAPRKRKPRHSAPAEMETKMEVVIANRFQPSPLSVQQPAQETPVPLPVLRFLQPSISLGEPSQQSSNGPMPLVEKSANIVSAKPENYSILSAVKANPRRRRTKKIFEQGHGNGPLLVPAQANETKRRRSPTVASPKPRGRSKSMGNPMDITALLSSEPSSPVKERPHDVPDVKDAWSGTDRIAEQLMNELQAFQSQSSSPPQTSGLPSSAPPAAVPMSSSHSTVLPPFRQHFADHFRPQWINGAFVLYDPLCGHYGYPPAWLHEWSCTDQLEREAQERQRLQHAMGLRR